MVAEGVGFDALYAGVYPRLVAELTVMTGRHAEAEEAVQEAFVRALSRWRRVSTLDAPEAWVRRVAVNVAISRWRRARRAAAAVLRLQPAPPRDVDSELLMASGLSQLGRDQRSVLVLHHVAGLPLDEIAALLGVPVGTVKSRLARGRDRLAELLQEREEAGRV